MFFINIVFPISCFFSLKYILYILPKIHEQIKTARLKFNSNELSHFKNTFRYTIGRAVVLFFFFCKFVLSALLCSCKFMATRKGAILFPLKCYIIAAATNTNKNINLFTLAINGRECTQCIRSIYIRAV